MIADPRNPRRRLRLSELLAASRRQVLVGSAFSAALLTPSDPLEMLVLICCAMSFYEAAVHLCRWLDW